MGNFFNLEPQQVIEISESDTPNRQSLWGGQMGNSPYSPETGEPMLSTLKLEPITLSVYGIFTFKFKPFDHRSGR